MEQESTSFMGWSINDKYGENVSSIYNARCIKHDKNKEEYSIYISLPLLKIIKALSIYIILPQIKSK